MFFISLSRLLVAFIAIVWQFADDKITQADDKDYGSRRHITFKLSANFQV